MGKQHLYLFLICLLKLFYLSHALNSSSCPIDFNYVNTLPWDVTACTTAIPPSTQDCCLVLWTLFAVGLSRHLNKTKTFFLPNTQTSISCFSDFQAHLALISVRQPITTCLTSDNEFVADPSNCGGIMRLSDWVDIAGPTPSLDSSCDGDLAGLHNCSSCLEAAMTVNSQLVSLSRNSTKCFYIIALYAAGIINRFGPEDIRTSNCILGASFSNPISRSNSISKKNIIFAISGGLIGIALFFGLCFVYIIWKHKKKEAQLHKDYVRRVKARVFPINGAKWFGIAELDVATNLFSEQNFIGQGTFGAVYKGTLCDETIVAVKKMIRFDIEADQDFINEAEIISKIKHRNLLPLRGFSVTSDPIKGNERYLVYDFMPNGNLHVHIFNETKRLSWPQRKSIILDVAKGLSYCHNGIKPAIFHRDIKPTNILLDSNMKAIIADFGLAKQSKDGQTHMTTRVAGTYGYVAPEYALYGQLTEKSDVYSFGIIVLEIMSGRKVLEEVKGENSRMVLIADWAWEMVKSERMEEVFDSSMIVGALSNGVMMNRFIRVGLLCAHAMVSVRPTILEALKMLEGDMDIPRLLDRPPPLGHESSRSTFQLSNSLYSSSQGSIATSSLNT